MQKCEYQSAVGKDFFLQTASFLAKTSKKKYVNGKRCIVLHHRVRMMMKKQTSHIYLALVIGEVSCEDMDTGSSLREVYGLIRTVMTGVLT